MFPWEASGSCTNTHTNTHTPKAGSLIIPSFGQRLFAPHSPSICLHVLTWISTHLSMHACTHTDTHHVSVLSFYTSCSPPSVFTQPPELSERNSKRYQGLIYKTAHRVQTVASARQAENTHSHTVHACAQTGSVFTVRLQRKMKNRHFCEMVGAIKSTPPFIPPFRLAGPSPVMQRYTQCHSSGHVFTTSFVSKGMWHFYVILQSDWTLGPREKKRGRKYCMQTVTLLPSFSLLDLASVYHYQYLCDSFPQLAKHSRILQHAFSFFLELEKRKNRM